MAGNRYLTLVAGVRTWIAALVVSAGSGSAGSLVALDASGKLDSTVMPSGIGASTRSCVASAAITAGMWVNLYSNAGVLNARPADNTAAGQEANAFATASVSSAATGTFTLSGVNGNCTGLTIGSIYYLGTVGASVVGASLPSTSGNVIQPIGKALSATEMEFVPDYPVTIG